MQVALITPVPLLAEFASRSKYHLTLATEILDSLDYQNYYRYARKVGDYVMLDNCAYELGKSVSSLQLRECINLIDPNAMFLPDTRFNTKATLEQVKNYAPFFADGVLKLFAVPQGNSLQEVLFCYDELRKDPLIDGFGIYEEIGEVTGTGRRADFLRLLEATGRVDEHRTYHCLGMEEDVEQIKELAKFPWVMGVDSAKPIVYGIHGISLAKKGPLVPYPHRPKNYFEHSDVQFRSVIHHNISMVQQWVQNPLANIW
jgi:hypothetical protein